MQIRSPTRLALDKARLDALLQVDQMIGGKVMPIELVEMIRLRVSQLNNCEYCIAMHRSALKRLQMPQSKIDAIEVWRKCGSFTKRELAAFSLAEQLTTGIKNRSPNHVEVGFEPIERTELVLAIAMINLWNRLAAGLEW